MTYHYHSFSSVPKLRDFLKSRPAGEQLTIVEDQGNFTIISRPDPYDNAPLVAGMQAMEAGLRELRDTVKLAGAGISFLLVVLIAATILI